VLTTICTYDSVASGAVLWIMFIPASNGKQEVRQEGALIKALVHKCVILITYDFCCNKSTVCIPPVWYMQFHFVYIWHTQWLCEVQSVTEVCYSFTEYRRANYIFFFNTTARTYLSDAISLHHVVGSLYIAGLCSTYVRFEVFHSGDNEECHLL
jgi:hypothetical protein